MLRRPWIFCVVAMVWLTSGVDAQPATDATEKEIERYRAMISDPMANPAFLNVDRGGIRQDLQRAVRAGVLEYAAL